MVKNLPLLVIPAKAGIYAFGIIGFPPEFIPHLMRGGNDNPEVLVEINFHRSCLPAPPSVY